MKRKDEIIKQLNKVFCDYNKAVALKKELKEIYTKEYKPQHTKEEYLDLILDYGVCEIEEVHSQNPNFADSIYETFSEVSQHVRGKTKEHCLDQIWDAAERKKKRIEEYKKLPSLNELVESDKKINPKETYNFRDKDDYEDSCYGYSGDIILRMRERGIKKVQYEMNKEFYDEWDDFLLKRLDENLLE